MVQGCVLQSCEARCAACFRAGQALKPDAADGTRLWLQDTKTEGRETSQLTILRNMRLARQPFQKLTSFYTFFLTEIEKSFLSSPLSVKIRA